MQNRVPFTRHRVIVSNYITLLYLCLGLCLGCGTSPSGPTASQSTDSSGSDQPLSASPANASSTDGAADSGVAAHSSVAAQQPLDREASAGRHVDALQLPAFADVDSAEQTAPTSADTETAEGHLAQRQQLDQTLWSEEVDAQRHEQLFVQLWDNLRAAEKPLEVLAAFPFKQLSIGQPGEPRQLDLGVRMYELDQEAKGYTPESWRRWLSQLSATGFRLEQSEWHHSAFQRITSKRSRSRFDIVLDMTREAPPLRASVRGVIEVEWSDTQQSPQPTAISTGPMTLLVRDGQPAFRRIRTIKTDAEHKRLMPLIVHDLNGDHRSDILLGGLNRIEINQGNGRFRSRPIRPEGLDIFDAAVLADFTGDGRADLVCVGTDRHPLLLEGREDGRFLAPRQCADYYLEFPKSFTAGDMDDDGDLDLWIGQYKFPYVNGAMPTPFYDANDGYPSVLLRNEGDGNFVDVTEAAGLAAKRRRRTYSSSFVDLDLDNDLDLIVVSDFSGVDLYENDGRGYFTDVTDQWIDERHHFGMAHTFSDYDLDGQLDFYVIGMSSTTARRLDRMGLGRADHPDINRMRAAMGYGNRMYLARREGDDCRFVHPAFAEQVARTGWSWGTTSFDFDRDGDRDIYVANGHNSGESATDYCTRYWCHDVYTGTSTSDPELEQLFSKTLQALHQGDISWNGFEHNVLLTNQAGKGFVNMGFLMGVGFEFDSRSVVSDDLNGDGRPDLLVAEYHSERRGHAEYALHVLQNELESPNHWIGIRLVQGPGEPSPIGAQIVVTCDGRQHVDRIVNGDSFSSQHATAAHFGLGEAERVDLVEVRWLDGSRQRLQAPEVDRWYTVSPNGAD